jgi:hypothetical protein
VAKTVGDLFPVRLPALRTCKRPAHAIPACCPAEN